MLDDSQNNNEMKTLEDETADVSVSGFTNGSMHNSTLESAPESASGSTHGSASGSAAESASSSTDPAVNSATSIAQAPTLALHTGSTPATHNEATQAHHNHLYMYSTTVSDVGTVRSNNQDSSFAGEHIIAICDGMGGHAGGDTASTIAIRSLAHIERDDTHSDPAVIADMMETSVLAAHDAIVGKAKRERKLAGMGTTVTTVALVNGYWVLAHIGDSRAYLLHDGRLIRMTQDHSYVQHLINSGRISESEARNHPQRNVVMRVLGDFDIDPRPDIAIRKAHPADRWLLCSDGLSGVLENDTIREVLSNVSDQGQCAQQLVSMALKAGSTDNVTAVIADATLALDADAFDLPHQVPLVGGAASASLEPIADVINSQVATSPALYEGLDSPAQRAAALSQESLREGAAHSGRGEGDLMAQAVRLAQPSSVREEHGDIREPDTGEIPIVRKGDGRISADPNDPDVAKAIVQHQVQRARTVRERSRRGRIIGVIATFLILAVLSSIAWAGYAWTQSKYYLGSDGVHVTINQGIPTNIFGFDLSHEVESTTILVYQLPQSWREQLKDGIMVESLSDAREHAELIRKEAKNRETDENTNSTSSSTSNTTSDTKSSTKTDSTSKQSSSSGSSNSSSTTDSTTKSESTSSSTKTQSSSTQQGGDKS